MNFRKLFHLSLFQYIFTIGLNNSVEFCIAQVLNCPTLPITVQTSQVKTEWNGTQIIAVHHSHIDVQCYEWSIEASAVIITFLSALNLHFFIYIHVKQRSCTSWAFLFQLVNKHQWTQGWPFFYTTRAGSWSLWKPAESLKRGVGRCVAGKHEKLYVIDSHLFCLLNTT